MPTNLNYSPMRVLTPDERIVEVLFGLIMVTTFTGSLSIAESGRDDVRAMLIGAIGCNLAWAIIDAIMYLMGCLAERGRNRKAHLAARRATNPETARRIIADALPSVIASVLTPQELTSIHERLLQLPEPPEVAGFEKEDYWGALGVFLLVFVATFPVTIPFMLIHSTAPAMRTSNAIAIAMLFILGYAFGRAVGRNPWLHAIAMVLLGGALVALTIMLGG